MTEPLPLHEQGRSRAVLMGTWDYQYLPSVPAARFSFNRMDRLLTSPACGWASSDITRIKNETGPGDLADLLMTSFEDARDVALFYYVGHGQLNNNDELCLGLGRSRSELNRRSPTSLGYKAVREALRNSDARVKIVILDCCYSGKAVDPTHSLGSSGSPALQVLDSASGAGAYVMTASSPYQEAWCEVGADSAEPQTYFTKYLADTIEHGVPKQPGRLTLGLLFTAVRDRLTANQLPIPQRRSVNEPEGYFFARNMAPRETLRDPQETIREMSREIIRLRAQLSALPGTYSAEIGEVEHALHERQADMTDLKAAELSAPRTPASHPEPVQRPAKPTSADTTLADVIALAKTSDRGGICSELRRLHESAGSPSAAEISRLTRHTAVALSEQAVHEILIGRCIPSVEDTLAIATAVGSYAEEMGRRLPSSDYDREAWRARYERLVGDRGEGVSAAAGARPDPPGETSKQGLIIATEIPDGRQARTRDLSSTLPDEAIREARRLEAGGRIDDAERLLRREGQSGSLAAMEERVALLRRQGRTNEASRALHEAAEAGSAKAIEALQRIQHGRRDDNRKSQQADPRSERGLWSRSVIPSVWRGARVAAALDPLVARCDQPVGIPSMAFCSRLGGWRSTVVGLPARCGGRLGAVVVQSSR
ncbi:MAG: caspase family protein [Solirubrobacteraceae bacterium]